MSIEEIKFKKSKGEFEIFLTEIPTKKRNVFYGDKFEKKFVCPFCFSKNYRGQIVADVARLNSFHDNVEDLQKHMVECFKNPRRVKFRYECERKHNRFMNQSTKEIGKKFLMANGFYHKSFSTPEMDYFDLCHVDEETEEAYIGAFVFGLGLFNVVFPKDKVRELTEEEIKQYHNQNIAINSNPTCMSINIKENKFGRPLLKKKEDAPSIHAVEIDRILCPACGEKTLAVYEEKGNYCWNDRCSAGWGFNKK